VSIKAIGTPFFTPPFGPRRTNAPAAERLSNAKAGQQCPMPRILRAAIIQATCPPLSPGAPLAAVKDAAIQKHLELIRQAAEGGANVCCLQELFFAPYFPAEQDPRWYDLAERVPDGPTVRLMRDQARRHGMTLIVPMFEEEMTGVFFNTAAVISHTGEFLGRYRKHHLPHCLPGFWEKFYFTPGTGGYPVFDTPFGKLGVYICYDRHFPEGARELGLAGAEVVFNPSATVAGLSEYLWRLEQPAHAVANQYYVAAINRVGIEKPWEIGEFYGSSYFCDPRGRIIAQAARDRDEVLIADLDLDMIAEVRRVWQFYRDRRPETYTGEAGVGTR